MSGDDLMAMVAFGVSALGLGAVIIADRARQRRLRARADQLAKIDRILVDREGVAYPSRRPVVLRGKRRESA